MSYQEKRKKYRSWPYIYKRSKDWLLDPMLVWTIGDHRCTGLIKCILFDYSYASFGVRIAKQLALQFFNIYCYSARGNSIGSIFFSSLSEPSPGHGISLGHRLSSEPRGRREEDEKEREEEEEKEREERKEEKLGVTAVPLYKFVELSSSHFPQLESFPRCSLCYCHVWHSSEANGGLSRHLMARR